MNLLRARKLLWIEITLPNIPSTQRSIQQHCEGSTDGWYDFGPELGSIEKLLKSRLSDKENHILKRVHTAHVYTATFLGDDDDSED